MAVGLPLVPRWLRWSAVAAVASIVLLASVVDPGPALRAAGPFGIVGADVWTHFLAYAGLAGAVAYALAHRDADLAVGLAALVAVAYGVGIDLVQSWLPYRSFDVADLLVNAAGAAAAVGVWRVLVAVVDFRPVLGAAPGPPTSRSDPPTDDRQSGER